MPFARQEQLVWICESSHSVGLGPVRLGESWKEGEKGGLKQTDDTMKSRAESKRRSKCKGTAKTKEEAEAEAEAEATEIR